MNDSFNDQLFPKDQFSLDIVDFVCPFCHEIPEAAKESDETIILRPCGHEFRRDDLTGVIERLRILDTLIQRHDAATTALERQGIREEIHATGIKLDTVVNRCTGNMA